MRSAHALRFSRTLCAFSLVLGVTGGAAMAQIQAPTPNRAQNNALGQALPEGVLRTISVSGLGEVSLPPDMASITLGIQSDAESSALALDEASAATQAILDRLNLESIDPSDIRSGAIRLQPRYSSSVLSSGQQITGYRAVNTVQVDVMNLDELGGLLSVLVADGANRLDRVSFGLQDPSAAMDDARRLAVADAMRRADLYAQAAGVPLGDVLSLSEQGAGGYRALMAEPGIMAEMAQSAPSLDVPIAPGEIDLTASLTMVFAIGD